MNRSKPSGRRLDGVLDLFPLAIFGRGEDGVADVLRFQGFAEGGRAGSIGTDGLDEIGGLVNEAFGVADLQALSRHTS